jgi:hypothetical protein
MEGDAGRRPIAFTLTLSAVAKQDVTVRWATANGTATAGSDYLAGSGSVTIRAGERTAAIKLWVLGDRIREANETFFVDLSSSVGATLSTTARRATGLIVSDDGLSRSALAAAFASMQAFNDKAKK